VKQHAIFAVISLVPMSLLVAAAAAQDQNQTQMPTQAPTPTLLRLADAYRGTIVCEIAPGSVDILRVPFDLVVRGNEVQFARPLPDPRGPLVFGSELGSGSVDTAGKVQMTSTWGVGTIVGRGDYDGKLTPSGGTLSGTQSWHAAEGDAHSRSCHIALVQAAHAHKMNIKQ
jgi:hypothetical protein